MIDDKTKTVLRRLIVATVVLYVACVYIGIRAYLDTSDNKDALCALRADLERRVDSSRAFLVTHPSGIPGIPSEQIVLTIKNSERTIDALADINCG